MIDLLWLSWFEDWCCFDGCVVVLCGLLRCCYLLGSFLVSRLSAGACCCVVFVL